MNKSKRQCEFKVDNSFIKNFQCPHEKTTLESSYCIFHTPKYSEDDKASLDDKELKKVEAEEKNFRVLFFKELDEITKDDSIEYFKFIGFQFPSIDFSGKEFTKAVDLRGAIFSGAANFSNAKFRSGVDFGGAFFHTDANFSTTIFHAKAVFNHVKFKKAAYFNSSSFNAEADFMYCIFNGDAKFGISGYDELGSFGVFSLYFGARFKEKTLFVGTKFYGEVEFEDNLFGTEVSFYGVTFNQLTKFLTPNKETSNETEFNFSNVFFGDKAIVIFQQFNLTKTRFIDTNLESIDFRNVIWPKPATKLKLGRQRLLVLWDEYRTVGKVQNEHEYEKIAENYRQLVLNYERKRDYDSAEVFHIGEMEMRRRKLGIGKHNVLLRKSREWLNGYGVYRFLSNYGTSYWQALMILMIFILVFSAIFLCTGFQHSNDSESYGKSGLTIIEYNLFPDKEHYKVSFKQLQKDYNEAVLFTLSILTFQRERFYEPVGRNSRLWLYIAVFVLASQGALVLLSIRRKFRR